MQHDQAAQGDGVLAEENDDYKRDCRDTIANLVERIYNIQEELMTYIELHGPRIIVALKEEHEVRLDRKVLMDDCVRQKMECMERLIIKMKRFAVFDAFIGEDVRGHILNNLKGLQKEGIELEDIK